MDHLLIPPKADLHGVFLGIEDHVHIHFFVEGTLGTYIRWLKREIRRYPLTMRRSRMQKMSLVEV